MYEQIHRSRVKRPALRGVEERNRLVEEHARLVRWFLHHCTHCPRWIVAIFGLEECESLCLCALLRAAELWDGRIKFSAYVCGCKGWFISVLYRAVEVQKARWKRELSLEEELEWPDGRAAVEYAVEGLWEPFQQLEEREELERGLATLSPRACAMVQLRYGLDDGADRTLEEIGLVYNISRERVRQIVVKAERRLEQFYRERT